MNKKKDKLVSLEQALRYLCSKIPGWKYGGKRTGRFSSKEPQQQQMPRHTE